MFCSETSNSIDPQEFFLNSLNSLAENADSKTSKLGSSSASPALLNDLKNNKDADNSNRFGAMAFTAEEKRTPRPYLPTIETTILSKLSKEYVTCPANSREPVQFETEFFKGCAVLALRTTPKDQVYDTFFKGTYTLVIQVQGKFKRQPKGEVYCGSESQDKMELGMITRTISKSVCSFASNVVPDLHYSLGDSQNSPNYQLPHMVAPLFPTMEKLVVTPPGGTPPLLGVPLEEDPEHKARRRKFKSIKEANIDLDSTYSFSINTSNIDLTTWNIVNVPMLKSLEMRHFFGDSPIRLVTYELPDEVLQTQKGLHPFEKLNYAFCIKIAPIDADKIIDISIDPTTDNDDDYEDRDTIVDRDTMMSRDTIGFRESVVESPGFESRVQANRIETEASNRNRATSSPGLDDDDDDDDMDEIGYADDDDANIDNSDIANEQSEKKRSILSPMKRIFQIDKDKSKAVGKWFRKQIQEINQKADTIKNIIEIQETSEYVVPDYDSEATTELRYCPATIDVNDYKREGSRRVLYVLPWSNTNTRHQSEMDNLTPRLRPYTEISKNLTTVPIPKLYKNKKLSTTEKKRRHVVESYKQSLSLLSTSPTSPSSSKMITFLNNLSDFDRSFLGHQINVIHRERNRAGLETFEGTAAIAQDRRHWMEQYMVVTKAEMSFYKNADAKRVTSKIALSSILGIRPMKTEELPFQGFCFFQVETFARVYYFMVRTEQLLDDWMKALTSFLGQNIVLTGNMHSSSVPNLAEPDGTYLANHPSWKLDKKRLFNCRNLVFNPLGLPRRIRDMHPCKLVEGILSKCFTLSALEANGLASDTVNWLVFMEELSALQTVDISLLNETEKVAFLLNLYHLMVLHGSLIIGPPPSWSSWQSFFNTVTYSLSFDIVSIAELEHNMLRAAMSRPSPLLSKITAPNSEFPNMCLTQGDFRLNFCINNGSRSLPKYVPIYKPESLDRQLDEMTSMTLAETVEIDTSRKTVILPKVCSWFLNDFVPRKPFTGPPAPADCLRVAANYLRGNNHFIIIIPISISLIIN